MSAVLAAKSCQPGFKPMLAGLRNPLVVDSLPKLTLDTYTIYDAPDISVRFNMGPTIQFFDGKFFAAWNQGANEGVAHNHILYATSDDGETWSEPQDLTPAPPDGWTEGAASFWLRGADLWCLYLHSEVGGSQASGGDYYGHNMALRGNKWNGTGWDAYVVICKNCMIDKPPVLLPNGKWQAFGRDRTFATQFIVGDISDPVFTPNLAFNFGSSVDGWTVANGTMAAAGGVLTLHPTSDACYIVSAAGQAIAGPAYPIVQMRVRRTNGSGPLADLHLYFYVGGTLYSGGIAASPANPGQWSIVEWDMSSNANWTGKTITRLRVDVGTTGDTIEIDSIKVGGYVIGDWRRLIVSPPEGAMLNEPNATLVGDGSLIAYEFRNEEDMNPRTLLRSFSFDNGRTVTTPKVTNFPDAQANRAVLRLSDGRYLLSSNASQADGRTKLMLSVSDNGLEYDRVYMVRDEATTVKWGAESYWKSGYQYPQMIEKDGYLWIIYSRNKEDIQISKVALSAFT